MKAGLLCHWRLHPSFSPRTCDRLANDSVNRSVFQRTGVLSSHKPALVGAMVHATWTTLSDFRYSYTTAKMDQFYVKTDYRKTTILDT
jgi:hypothetical protein